MQKIKIDSENVGGYWEGGRKNHFYKIETDIEVEVSEDVVEALLKDKNVKFKIINDGLKKDFYFIGKHDDKKIKFHARAINDMYYVVYWCGEKSETFSAMFSKDEVERILKRGLWIIINK